MSPFRELWNALQVEVHKNSTDKGFWQIHDTVTAYLKDAPPEVSVLTDDVTDTFISQRIKLIGDELSELHEAMRDGNPPSVKAVGFSMIEEELADVVIRTMDVAGKFGWDVAGAIEAKMAYNAGRPYKHSRKF